VPRSFGLPISVPTAISLRLAERVLA
jgi:hypothetical protein